MPRSYTASRFNEASPPRYSPENAGPSCQMKRSLVASFPALLLETLSLLLCLISLSLINTAAKPTALAKSAWRQGAASELLSASWLSLAGY